jgi:hypothetical protein
MGVHVIVYGGMNQVLCARERDFGAYMKAQSLRFEYVPIDSTVG